MITTRRLLLPALALALAACRSESALVKTPSGSEPSTPDLPTVTTPDDPDTEPTVDTADSGGTGTDPLPSCPVVDPELCGNGIDDDSDGDTDCALEGMDATPVTTLTGADAGWLYTPGDLDGDGAAELVGANAIDVPIERTATSVLRGPLPSGAATATFVSAFEATGYTGTAPTLGDDFDSDGAPDLVLPMILERGWTCASPLAWEVYLLPLTAPGTFDAATTASSTLRPPSGWASITPWVAAFRVGDPTGDGRPDLVVAADECPRTTWFLLDGADLAPGVHEIDDVATAWLRFGVNPAPFEAFALGDVTGDGVDDLGVSTVDVTNQHGTLSVIAGPVGGEIDLASAVTEIPLGAAGQFVGATVGHDLSGDGVGDVVLTANGPGGGVWVLQAPLPAGTIDLATDRWSSYATPGVQALRAAIGDLNADGSADLAIGVWDDGVHVDYAPCPGDHALPPDGVTSLYSNGFVLFDGTGDGHLDVVIPVEDGVAGGLELYAGGPRP